VWRRLHALLGGVDGPGRRALPLGEFLHPVPLLALVALAVNDHLLKGAGLLPRWVTGKISDFAGLFFFPLLLTAAGDCLLLLVARLTGWRVDFSLRRWKLVAACLLTAAVFVPLELSGWWADFYVRTLGRIGFPSATYQDLSDLLALVMLPLAYLFAVRVELRRVPLGRLEVLERRGVDDAERAAGALADVGPRGRVAPLAADVARWVHTRHPTAGAALGARLDAWRGLVNHDQPES
jgi:hypothetical protein